LESDILGSEINGDTILSTLLFTDDQVLLSDAENYLHIVLYTLHNTTKQFGMKISPIKYEVMLCKRQVPIRSKILINNTILEQEIYAHIWVLKFHMKRKKTALKIRSFVNFEQFF
jgi:predicted DNA-binding transcriptional regulator